MKFLDYVTVPPSSHWLPLGIIFGTWIAVLVLIEWDSRRRVRFAEQQVLRYRVHSTLDLWYYGFDTPKPKAAECLALDVCRSVAVRESPAYRSVDDVLPHVREWLELHQ